MTPASWTHEEQALVMALAAIVDERSRHGGSIDRAIAEGRKLLATMYPNRFGHLKTAGGAPRRWPPRLTDFDDDRR